MTNYLMFALITSAFLFAFANETFGQFFPPTVVTSSATLVTSNSATLNGAANPNGSSTTGWFRYSTIHPGSCNDSFGTRAPSSGGTALGGGSSLVPYSRSITGLSAGTTYYFCAVASNGLGTAFGSIQSFTAQAAAPAVTTLAGTQITVTSAQLNGSVNPSGSNATGWFRYSTVNPGTCNDSFGTRLPATGGTSLGSGSNPVSYSQPATGLTTAVTYYFCAIAENSIGTSFGSVLQFTTSPPPVPTAFTYQGRLMDGGSAANGAYDFIFRLYSEPTGDSQVGSEVLRDDVNVQNGVFTVMLDFGALPFTGQMGRYLEIWVRPGAGTGGYTQLTPRSPITSSPYAVQAASLADQLGALTQNQLVLGELQRQQQSAIAAAKEESIVQKQQIEQQQKTIDELKRRMEALTKLLCKSQPTAEVCKQPE